MPYDFSRAIKILSNGASDLVKLIEKCDRQQPFTSESKKIMWKEQCYINFPILYLASIYLYNYAQEHGCKTFLFATRDCSQYYRVFHALYPKADAHYFHCSRLMFEQATATHNPAYQNYVDSLVKDIDATIFIDIHGTGKRVFDFFQKRYKKVPYCFLLSTTSPDYDELPEISHYWYKRNRFINLVFDIRGGPIEMLNYDLIGTLQNYGPNGPIRDVLEYKSSWVAPYHESIDVILKELSPIKSRDSPNLKTLYYQINALFKLIREDRPSVSDKINHISKHKVNAKIVKEEMKKKATPTPIPNLTKGDQRGDDKGKDGKRGDDKGKDGRKDKGKDGRGDGWRDLQFNEVLNNSGVYGVVWAGTYHGQTCAIKVVKLDGGRGLKDGGRGRKGGKSELPFRKDLFEGHKVMEVEAFELECNNLNYLSQLGLAPEVFDSFIEDGYGIIAMEKLDGSVKDVLLRRSLSEMEAKLAISTIKTLHQKHGIVHGDMKPSNMGVRLDHKGKIVQCVVIDCQKVKFKANLSSDDFNKRVKRDRTTFKTHYKQNRKDAK